jgi:hypothetical protein
MLKHTMGRRYVVLAAAIMVGIGVTRQTSADTKPQSRLARAEIFLMRWEIQTFTSVTPEAVRAGYASMTVLRDDVEIAGLRDALNLAALHPATDPTDRDGDFRLVIDFVRVDGTKETFAAEFGRLVRLVDGASRPIDGNFRRRFSFSKGASP